MTLSLIYYLVLVALNMVLQMQLDDKIKAELKANQVEITQVDWLMYYANILVFDIAIEFLIAVVLNFLKCTCEKLYYRLIGTVACRGFAEST